MTRIQRHPLAMTARFRDAVVLTYAFPASVLQGLVPPTLSLEVRDGLGFVAVALVDMDGLRPSGLPGWCGTDAVFVGYRAFVRAELPDGRTRRGLKVIRTDVDRLHVLAGTRLLTRYDTGLVAATWSRDGRSQRVGITSRWRGAAIALDATLDGPPLPPPGSPFGSWEQAAPYSGPLPWTFAPEDRASVVAVKGVRSTWDPQPISVQVEEVELFSREPFAGHQPRLAAAFHVGDVDYAWRAGRHQSLVSTAGGGR